jgi:hypothetical protein
MHLGYLPALFIGLVAVGASGMLAQKRLRDLPYKLEAISVLEREVAIRRDAPPPPDPNLAQIARLQNEANTLRLQLSQQRAAMAEATATQAKPQLASSLTENATNQGLTVLSAKRAELVNGLVLTVRGSFAAVKNYLEDAAQSARLVGITMARDQTNTLVAKAQWTW